ncbi:MAG: serine hydrolase [Lewinellaceae bacterium]|nr:serine hydrolase [Lewinellaceae bacterium]
MKRISNIRQVLFVLAVGLGLWGVSAPAVQAQSRKLLQLQARITAEFQRSPGSFALAFRDIQKPRRTLLMNEHESIHAASTMKTPVMLEVYKQAAAGRFQLTDSLVIKNEFASIVDGSPYSLSVEDDSEPALYKRLGQKASIYELMYAMIIYSSNLATNIIIELVDAKNVTQTMRDLGAADIQVLRGVEDGKAYRQGLNNTTTAYDLLLLFEKLGKRELVSAEASEAMIRILLDQKFNELIPAKLPADVQVAHKTGWITAHSHDSALVMLPDGRQYVLVILSRGWESNDLATEVMANVSKMIYDFMVSGR